MSLAELSARGVCLNWYMPHVLQGWVKTAPLLEDALP